MSVRTDINTFDSTMAFDVFSPETNVYMLFCVKTVCCVMLVSAEYKL